MGAWGVFTVNCLINNDPAVCTDGMIKTNTGTVSGYNLSGVGPQIHHAIATGKVQCIDCSELTGVLDVDVVYNSEWKILQSGDYINFGATVTYVDGVAPLVRMDVDDFITTWFQISSYTYNTGAWPVTVSVGDEMFSLIVTWLMFYPGDSITFSIWAWYDGSQGATPQDVMMATWYLLGFDDCDGIGWSDTQILCAPSIYTDEDGDLYPICDTNGAGGPWTWSLVIDKWLMSGMYTDTNDNGIPDALGTWPVVYDGFILFSWYNPKYLRRDMINLYDMLTGLSTSLPNTHLVIDELMLYPFGAGSGIDASSILLNKPTPPYQWYHHISMSWSLNTGPDPRCKDFAISGIDLGMYTLNGIDRSQIPFVSMADGWPSLYNLPDSYFGDYNDIVSYYFANDPINPGWIGPKPVYVPWEDLRYTDPDTGVSYALRSYFHTIPHVLKVCKSDIGGWWASSSNFFTFTMTGHRSGSVSGLVCNQVDVSYLNKTGSSLNYDYGLTGMLTSYLTQNGDLIPQNEACLEVRPLLCEDPRDFVIVLDRSGSMGNKTSGQELSKKRDILLHDCWCQDMIEHDILISIRLPYWE